MEVIVDDFEDGGISAVWVTDPGLHYASMLLPSEQVPPDTEALHHAARNLARLTLPLPPSIVHHREVTRHMQLAILGVLASAGLPVSIDTSSETSCVRVETV
ncbi:hypothetical protein [Nocardia sp. CC227C]|uniref:hypothetical protein n=1 Tax=Nocardia sp. CC227C TaxID=3044562 RepID=UPI00278C30AB|nr:hypothetical protein [Nocardia sp. CC227C]